MATYRVTLQTIAAHVRDVEAETPEAALEQAVGDAPDLCVHCADVIELGDWSDERRRRSYSQVVVIPVDDGGA